MTATVQHQSAVAETWLVLDVQYGQFVVFGGQDELMEGCQRMADSLCILGLQGDASALNVEGVGFIAQLVVLDQ